MFRVILRSLEPVPIISHLKRNLTDKKNPFVKAKFPPIPDLEIISARGRDLQELCQTHLSSRKVKHGDFDFLECNEGFILCYIDTLQRNVHPQNIFYGVYYGENHPLNMSGPVNGQQKLSNGRVIGILNAIRNFPEIGPKKLCFCSNCTRTLGMIHRLPIYIENGYRNLTNGRVLESKESYEKLVEVIRLRTDLQLRFLYTSADVVINMKRPLQLATSASRDEME